MNANTKEATSYTPGPWKQGWQLTHITKNGQTLAQVIYQGHHPAMEAEALANTTLIAAAPELLEACKKAKEYFYLGMPLEVMQMLDAAIAKAEGHCTQ